MKTIILILQIVLLAMFISRGIAQQTGTDRQKYLIRITEVEKTKAEVIENEGIRLMWHDRMPEAQAIVTQAQAELLISKGIGISVLYPASITVDPEYHTCEEMWVHLDSLVFLYPDLMTIDTLGYSHHGQLPIPIVKISDNAVTDEDETVIWYDGMHHAREPIGLEICLKIMDHLLSGYSSDPQVKKWVDDAEIFIVPCLNPDGWRYVTDSSLNNPWWRKNLADNNGNGSFDPGFDGVDLNRNYDFWWEYGVSVPSSELYRGPAPFSEPEITGKRDFMLSQKPVLSLTYHSYGEYVGYVKNLGYASAPDWPVMYLIANQMASLIPKINGGNYSTGTLAPTESQSSNWCYQAAGALEVLIETADVFIPSGPVGQQVAADNLEGALYLLERAFQSGVTGHAWDQITLTAVPATVQIVEIDNDQIMPRTCDSTYGRYTRLLVPGTYTLRAFAEGTDTVTVSDVVVNEDTLTVVDFLFNQVGIDESAVDSQQSAVRIYPNPTGGIVDCRLSIVDCQRVSIKFYDLYGREVAVVLDKQLPAGEHVVRFDASALPAGVYFWKFAVRSSQFAVCRREND